MSRIKQINQTKELKNARLLLQSERDGGDSSMATVKLLSILKPPQNIFPEPPNSPNRGAQTPQNLSVCFWPVILHHWVDFSISGLCSFARSFRSDHPGLFTCAHPLQPPSNLWKLSCSASSIDAK